MRLGLKLHQKGHRKLDCASEEEEEKARTFRVEFVGKRDGDMVDVRPGAEAMLTWLWKRRKGSWRGVSKPLLLGRMSMYVFFEVFVGFLYICIMQCKKKQKKNLRINPRSRNKPTILREEVGNSMKKDFTPEMKKTPDAQVQLPYSHRPMLLQELKLLTNPILLIDPSHPHKGFIFFSPSRLLSSLAMTQ